MKVIDESNFSNYAEEKVIALGNFDGFHIGHQKLINEAIFIARNKGLKSAVFTFKQHTSKILEPDNPPELITTLDQKMEILNSFSIDYGIFFDFTRELSLFSPEKFIEEILIKKLNMKVAVIGPDYRFGHKGLGDVEVLKAYSSLYSYEVHVVPKVVYEGIVVSSSLIRELIKSGEVEKAALLLNRYFAIKGKVIKGMGIGKMLGFPTANIEIPGEMVLPKKGVYVTIVKIRGKDFISVTNVGFKPTFGEKNLTIETHIIDFQEQLYEENIEIEFVKRIRDEIKFKSSDELKEQVFRDIEYAKNFKNILQQKHYVIK
ncbi:bifunctional riboflavin kinase/FAD synthetase [Caldanaerobacter sp.]|uniref:bifunctional riboflavin kinase/FAD synthetase n=1 Tax=Caldanaerobacter sp. TaxID=2930036 RepID=UPI003C73F887